MHAILRQVVAGAALAALALATLPQPAQARTLPTYQEYLADTSCIHLLIYEGWFACYDEFGPPRGSNSMMTCTQVGTYTLLQCWDW